VAKASMKIGYSLIAQMSIFHLCPEKYTNKEELYSRFGTRIGKHGVVIPKINNPLVQFATQLLSCKLICNCQKEECTLGVVLTMEHCDGGTYMAWDQYLLDEFIDDYLDSHDWGK
jgi:hypothetical protein